MSHRLEGHQLPPTPSPKPLPRPIHPKADDRSGPFVPVALGGTYLLARLSGQDPQCLVAPNSAVTDYGCWRLDEAGAKAYASSASEGRARLLLQQGGQLRSYRVLTCGQEMAALLGYSGYENAASWCSVAREALTTRG